jgi:O-antigen/teichoic acid export membrane protein
VPVLAAAMALMMLRLVLMARWLDVAAFADYSAGLLVSATLAMVGSLGMQPLLQREMPIFLARGQQRRAVVSMFQAMVVTVVVALLAWALAAAGAVGPGATGAAWAAGILHGLSQHTFLLTNSDSRARGEPMRFAAENLWRSLAVIAAGAIGATASGSGVLALYAEAAVSLLLVARLGRIAAARGGIAVTRGVALAVRRLPAVRWSTTVVFLGISVAAFGVSSIDRWAAAALLDRAGFALYSFSAIALLVAQSAQAMLNASFYPAAARNFALEGMGAAYNACARWSAVLAASGFIALLPAHWSATAFIEEWFPQYREAASLLWPLLAAGVLRLSDFWSSFLSICGFERWLLAVHVVATVCVGVGWFIGMRMGVIAQPRPIDCAYLALALSASSWLCAAAASAWGRWRAR